MLFCYPVVDQIYFARVMADPKHDILGFQVSMGHSVGVDVLQNLDELGADFKNVF